VPPIGGSVETLTRPYCSGGSACGAGVTRLFCSGGSAWPYLG